ncbi:sensor histidine kinase [Streptomyces sp. NBC_00638]|uniref:sensor histidine kinase n=1 Tax=unclassified Streptomyces TaxID=2593676 RepID=UPI00225A6C6F|nr:sensor histidine kinase [Streptomyces sp. NBC_00638]MCX5001171.1 sensor histidine kinase [Streptomyces sp. NBC_00638]
MPRRSDRNSNPDGTGTVPRTLRLSDTALRRTGAASAVVAVTVAALTVYLGRGLHFPARSGDQPVPYAQLLCVTLVLPASVVLIAARPRNPIGWLLTAVPVFGTAQDAASVYAARAHARPQERLPWADLAYSLGNSLWVPPLCLLIILVVFYPQGRLPAPVWSRVNWTIAGGALLATAGTATAARPAAEYYRGEGPVVVIPAAWTQILTIGGALLVAVSTLLVLGGACVRVRRAVVPERQQLLWLLAAVALLLGVSFVPAWGWVLPAALAFVSCAVTVGVLWYQLLGIEVILRRTLLYGGLTALVLSLYGAVTATVSAALPTEPAPAVVAAAVVAALLTPARDRLQKAVDRLVYGARHDPLRPLHDLGTQVSAAPAADPLSAVVQAVASALRTPYVALTAADGTLLAQTGTQLPAKVQPLLVAGTHVADLAVTPADRAGLSPADARVLEALTAPVALIVHAHDLNRQLEAARQRAAQASTAERTRIRNDLHDGLGPALSGVALGLEAVEASIAGQDVTLEELVTRLRSEVTRAVDDVRRVINALRPAALDRDSLVPALRERADTLMRATAARLQITVEAPEDAPALTEAVETTAFRIADEALTNVLKHADATHCRVRLSFGATLTLEITDDGHGRHSARPRPGRVGVDSMRRRAEELGGSFRTVRCKRGHTVRVELPLDG